MTIVPEISRPDFLTGPAEPDRSATPDRSLGTTLQDTAIDVGRGFVGAGRNVTTAGRDIAGEGGFWEGADKSMRAANDWLGDQYSPTGKAIEQGDVGWADRPVGHFVHEAANFAPWILIGSLAAAAAPEIAVGGVAAGPIAANMGLWAAMSDGQYRSSVRDIADKSPIDSLNKLPQFQDLLKRNNGDEKGARNELYQNMLSSRDEIMNAGIGAATGIPLAGPLVRRAGSRLGGAAIHAGELGVGLGAQSGAMEYSHQAAEQRVGIRERIDAAPIIDRTLETALTGAIMGGALGVARKPHAAAADEKPPGAIDTAPPAPPPVAADQVAALDAATSSTRIDPDLENRILAQRQSQGYADLAAGDPANIARQQAEGFARLQEQNKPPPPGGAAPPAGPPGTPPPPPPPAGGAGGAAAARPAEIPGAQISAGAEVTPAGKKGGRPPKAADPTSTILAELDKAAGGTPDEQQRALVAAFDAAKAQGVDLLESPEFRRRLEAAASGEAAPAAEAAVAAAPVAAAPKGKRGKQVVDEVARKRKERLENEGAKAERDRLIQEEQERERGEAESPEQAQEQPQQAQPLQVEEEARQPSLPLAEGQAVERVPEPHPLIETGAKHVGYNADGAPIWETYSGGRQMVVRRGDKDVLQKAGKRSKNPSFIAVERPRVLDIVPSAEQRQRRVETHRRLQENIDKLTGQVERHSKRVHWENIKGNVEDLLEGKETLDPNERATLSDSAKRDFDRTADRVERNKAARAAVEDHVAETRDNMGDMAADVNNDKELSFEHRAEQLRQMSDRLRQMRGSAQMLYNYLHDSIRAAAGRAPLFTREIEGGRPREGQGLWHNFVMRAASVHSSTEKLFRDMGLDPHKPISEQKITSVPSNSMQALMKLRANEIFRLDQNARRGEEGMRARAEESSSVNTGITEQRRASVGEVEKLVAEQKHDESTDVVHDDEHVADEHEGPARLDADEELPEHEAPAPGETHSIFEEAGYDDTVEPDQGSFTWEHRKERIAKEPEAPPPPVRTLEDKEKARRIKELEKLYSKDPARGLKARFSRAIRRRRDPELSDDHLDQLRKKDPEAARALDQAQNNPFDHDAQREALDGVLRAADKLTEPEDLALAEGIEKYLRQLVANQKKGLLYGRDVTAGPDARLDRLYAEDPSQFHTHTTGGAITDLMLKKTPPTASSLLRNLFLGRYRELIKDVPVTVLGEDAFRKYVGVFNLHNEVGLFNTETGHIVINLAELRRSGMNPAEVLGHELVHAATEQAFKENREFRDGIDRLREHVIGVMRRRGHDLKRREFYGLEDAHEMLAETWNNPDFKDHLASVPLTAEEWRSFGLDPTAPPAGRNVWRAMVNFVSRALGYGKYSRTALEAVMQLTERHLPTEAYPEGKAGPPEGQPIVRAVRRPDAIDSTLPSSRTLLNKITDLTPSSASPKFLGMHFFTQLIERGEEGFRQVTRPIYDTIAKIAEYRDKVLDEYKVEPLMKRLFDYTERQDKDGAFRRFLIDETMHGAYADEPLHQGRNEHISPTSLDDEQTRLQHKSMQDRWAAIAKNPEAVAIRQELHDIARRMGVNDANRQALEYYFQGRGDAPDLATAKAKSMLDRRNLSAPEQKLLDDAQIADKAEYEASLAEAKATPDFRRIAGPYVPLMRHGAHVVRGDYDLSGHATRFGGKLLDNGRTAEFTDPARAKQYVKAVTEELGIAQGLARRSVVDQDGKRSDLTPEQLDDLKTTDPAAAAPYSLRHQVDFNPEHFETFDRRGDAKRRLEQLRAHAASAKLPLKFRGVERLRDLNRHEAASPIFMSEELARITSRFQKSATFQNLPEARQQAVMRAFEEAGTRSKMRSAAAARFLPRQLTKGASDNLLRNYAEFFQSTANYVSRARHQLELEGRMADAEKYVGDPARAYEQKGEPGSHELRRNVLDEITRRVNQRPQLWSASSFTPAIQRMLGLSYLDKLASPGFLAVNLSEPMMLGIPMIGARHGGTRTGLMMARVYNELGGMGMLLRGGKDFGRALAGKDVATNWVDFIKRNIKDPNELALIDHIADRGWLNRNAEQQLEKAFVPEATSSKVGRVFDYADTVFRQLNTAVENLNRAATAIAAYRLEKNSRKGSGTHDDAVTYAEKKLAEIAGNYSAYNAPPIFNHPLGKMAFQFKKYPLRVLGNYIRLMADASKGDKDAMRGLMLATAAQTLVAGAMGLPTEPLKAVFTAGNIAGVAPSWDEVEHDVRAFMTRHFGPEMGEILSRGLPRYAGVDMGRLGHDSLLTFGTPPSTKPQDLKASAFNLLGGAPGSMVADWIQTAQDVAAAHGHYSRGANEQGDQKLLEAGRNVLPLKTGADVIDAYLRASKSRFTTSPSGAERQPLYGVGDQITRGLGFTPGWEAEMGEARRFGQSQRAAQQKERSAVVKEWVTATPAERNALWSSIEEWNRGQPADRRVTRGDLIKAQAQQNRQARAPASDLGIRFGKRDQSLKRELDVYNVH